MDGLDGNRVAAALFLLPFTQAQAQAQVHLSSTHRLEAVEDGAFFHIDGIDVGVARCQQVAPIT